MPTFAAVDIGSNSVRLKIARLTRHRLIEIQEDREVTRLGESVFRNFFLSPEAIATTVKVLRRFHRAVQNAGADSVRVVATSALRDARNARAFLEWVRSTTGWNVEIISGLEEARLIHLGLVSTLRVNSSPVLMADLGGGSCELTISSEGHIRNTVSLPLGAVRLTNEFLRHDPPRKSEMRQLRGFIFREIERTADRIKRARPKVVIATSGTAESLAAVCHGLYKTKGSRAATYPRHKCDASRNCSPGCLWKDVENFPALVRAAPRLLCPVPRFTLDCWSVANSRVPLFPAGIARRVAGSDGGRIRSHDTIGKAD